MATTHTVQYIHIHIHAILIYSTIQYPILSICPSIHTFLFFSSICPFHFIYPYNMYIQHTTPSSPQPIRIRPHTYFTFSTYRTSIGNVSQAKLLAAAPSRPGTRPPNSQSQSHLSRPSPPKNQPTPTSTTEIRATANN